MVKFGKICDVDLARMRYRVELDGDGVTTHWLPMLVPDSRAAKYFIPLEANTHVSCLMDDRCENGVVLGAIYDLSNGAGNGSADTSRITFPDGTVVEYDAGASKLTVTVGTVTFEAGSTGFDLTRGGESLKAILTDLIEGLAVLTVTCASPGSPSSPPVNLATFTGLLARIPNLLP